MPATTPEELRRAAQLLEEEAASVRRAVAGLTDLTGPTTWEGGTPRRITGEVQEAVATARRAADQLEATATLARHRAIDADRATVLPSTPHG